MSLMSAKGLSKYPNALSATTPTNIDPIPFIRSQTPPNLPFFILPIPPKIPAKPSNIPPIANCAHFIMNLPTFPRVSIILTNLSLFAGSAIHFNTPRTSVVLTIHAIIFSNGFKNFSNHANIPPFFSFSLIASSAPPVISCFCSPPSASASACLSFVRCRLSLRS